MSSVNQNQSPVSVPAPAPIAAPVNTGEDFIAEAETMDLRHLKDKTFLVAVSQGDRNKAKFLSTTARGPFTFVEMCEEVGVMWMEHQHHAKVALLHKDRNKALQFLDENTTDYIECHYTDIVTEAMLDGVFDDDKDYTCSANVVDDASETNPLLEKKEESVEEEDEM